MSHLSESRIKTDSAEDTDKQTEQSSHGGGGSL